MSSVLFRPTQGHQCRVLRRWVTPKDEPYFLERGEAERRVRHGVGEIEYSSFPNKPADLTKLPDLDVTTGRQIPPTSPPDLDNLPDKTLTELREIADFLGISTTGMRKRYVLQAVQQVLEAKVHVS